MDKYITFTQEALVRLLPDTPSDITGLNTNGIDTCIILVFVSSDGDGGDGRYVTAIHDSGCLSMPCIIEELHHHLHHSTSCCRVVYSCNPSDRHAQSKYLNRIIDAVEPLCPVFKQVITDGTRGITITVWCGDAG